MYFDFGCEQGVWLGLIWDIFEVQPTMIVFVVAM